MPSKSKLEKEAVRYAPDYNLVFIHVPKTAGSSISRVLNPISHRPKRTLFRSLTRRLPIVEDPLVAHFRIHDTAAFIRRKYGPAVYDAMTSFAVIRNPFDHAVSHYEYMKQYRNKPIAERFSKLSFEEYLAFRARPKRLWDRKFVHLADQAHFLVDEQDHLLVQHIIHMENLDAELAAFASKQGLPDFTLPHVNNAKARKSSRRTADYYSDEAVALVRQIYARDFQLFGYSADV